MPILLVAIVQILLLTGGARASAGDESLERLLRAQAFNREFEGFESYYVVIEADQEQVDGSHEVLAIASGKFSNNIKRLKVLFLIVDNRIIGGQILEGTGLPPCLAQEHRPSSSL
ncbi:MAG: hypothetical protein NBKEAIPA_00778 [Nitrospirae bacterium]|nr:MAG: hypothetical protein UZ03_NOB001003727 [Nitrospira sp. OLB3]MBV6468904.1 hypothetical protein [Nitrospirota bacterium]MCE7966118.1 hypothetical protein [Nitrospira sp. NTP2]MCK6492898.1 hypothetical protein [Nitrospira sp.]MEB2339149.1 hypothetical protein [Nitrospirales bacterium]